MNAENADAPVTDPGVAPNHPPTKADYRRSSAAKIILLAELPQWGCLGPVDKPVLAPAQPERLGRCNTDVATGVTR
jgi:hypothetical protein